ncbi:abnormal spindle-like microcephaly-associated protein homolog isoform X1 [Selaginella moellendorffii]|uniref:abnormal spindle-like microcephaly-associated protein homolog isoform X1 n=1 Tax=Selaginella moellendorffii TaxID=88036 RepID=UPI000D1C59B9|nr:abnormal spindle-like microcephaly-associated protein homolog isoform X1 [Selaginella moellendorffii]|eukprot:XP_024522077.1 abnormal spindle-like microcephaly-associated protein homolog isoform X1 [Selaginella moellendorffii]
MDTPVSKRQDPRLDADFILWCQSPLVFTSPGGNVSTRGRISRADKTQIDKPKEAAPQACENDENFHSKISCVSLPPGPLLPPRLRSSFSSQITPLKASNRQNNVLFPYSPSIDFEKTSSRTASKPLRSKQAVLRPPLSGKKKNKPVDYPETMVAKRENSLRSQEKLYVSWFNLVLEQAVKKAGVVTPQAANFGEIRKNDSRNLEQATSFRSNGEARGSALTGKENESLRTLFTLSSFRQRLSTQFDPVCREEIVSIMLQVGKRIDDGKLRMKDGCAVLADVGLRKKAVDVLLGFSPPWLKLGLYIVLGLSFGSDADNNDARYLESMLEQEFFVHAGIAKCYSTNKTVEGLYRQGYHEALGRVILKRLLIFVLVLDRLRCQTALQNDRGIDGLDGGSILLFRRDSVIKSSRQALQDILKNAMHGEGDLMAHLSTVGYRLIHVQTSLIEFNFQITSFKDFQDGVRLCRLAQVISGDTSGVKKIQLPPTLRKRQKHNCDVALEILSRAGVSLEDEHGYAISADFIVDGDHEIMLALAWNILIQVQIPHLLSKEALVQEIVRIECKSSEFPVDYSSLNFSDLLLKWGKMVCKSYGFELQNFKTPFFIARASCYLINFYLPACLPVEAFEPSPESNGCPCHFQILYNVTKKMGFLQKVLECCNGGAMNSFWMEKNAIFLLALMFSKLVCEDLQVLKDALQSEEVTKIQRLDDSAIRIQCCYRGWKTRRVYTNTRLAVCKIQCCWKRFLFRKSLKRKIDAATIIQKAWRSFLQARKEASTLRITNAVLRIQAFYRGSTQRGRYRKVADSIVKIQAAWRSFVARGRYFLTKLLVRKIEQRWEAVLSKRTFRKQRAAVTVIQASYRGWNHTRKYRRMIESAVTIQAAWKCFRARRAYVRTRWFIRKVAAALECRKFREQRAAAVVIQGNYRGWKWRKNYRKIVDGAVTIQAAWRCFVARRTFVLTKCAVKRIEQRRRAVVDRRTYEKRRAAGTVIQAHYKRWDQQKRLKTTLSSIRRIQASWRGYVDRSSYALLKARVVSVQQQWRRILERRQEKVTKIQAVFRGFLVRQRISNWTGAATLIQKCYRRYAAQKRFSSYRNAVVLLEAHYRRRRAQRSYLRLKLAASHIQSCFRSWLATRSFVVNSAARRIQSRWRKHVQRKKAEAANIAQAAYECWKARQTSKKKASRNLDGAATVLQSYWRGFCSRKRTGSDEAAHVHKRKQAATTIQSCYRGWKARTLLKKILSSAILIQAFWKGYNTRKVQTNELYQLRLRIQYAAATVDCNMTLGNRLNEALALLLSFKTVSSILHICATIDVATRHSKYCCDRIAEGGAIGKIVQLIQTTNRSTPHEQVLKHALSILGNLARYPALATTILNTPTSLEVVAEQLQMSRNKEEIFFKAVDVLKLVCKVSADDVARSKPLVLRRLDHVKQLLERKVDAERKNLERFYLGAAAQKISAEKKLADAKSQLQSVSSILKSLTGIEKKGRTKCKNPAR